MSTRSSPALALGIRPVARARLRGPGTLGRVGRRVRLYTNMANMDAHHRSTRVPPMSTQYPLLCTLPSAPAPRARPCERACTRPARPRRCRALAFGVQTCQAASKQTNKHAEPSAVATRSLGSADNSSADAELGIARPRLIIDGPRLIIARPPRLDGRASTSCCMDVAASYSFCFMRPVSTTYLRRRTER